jgi:hypothetical protein
LKKWLSASASRLLRCTGTCLDAQPTNQLEEVPHGEYWIRLLELSQWLLELSQWLLELSQWLLELSQWLLELSQ